MTEAPAVMPSGYFQVRLSVQPTAEGGIEVLPPQAVQDVRYQFVIVKDGAEEALIRAEAAAGILKTLATETGCKRLTSAELEALRASYPKPKLKSRYRTRPPRPATGDMPGEVQNFELDGAGNRIVDTMQTVRLGLYLLDVPVVMSESKHDR